VIDGRASAGCPQRAGRRDDASACGASKIFSRKAGGGPKRRLASAKSSSRATPINVSVRHASVAVASGAARSQGPPRQRDGKAGSSQRMNGLPSASEGAHSNRAARAISSRPGPPIGAVPSTAAAIVAESANRNSTFSGQLALNRTCVTVVEQALQISRARSSTHSNRKPAAPKHRPQISTSAI